MQSISKLFFLFFLTFSPFLGFCVYREDIMEFEKQNGSLYNAYYDYKDIKGHVKCLLLVDKIKNTTNEEKKNQLKLILEIEILIFIDGLQWVIERLENDLNVAYEFLDAENPIILGAKQQLEWLQLKRDRMERLLYHTL